MRKRLTAFGICSIILAVLIFIWSYILYHHTLVGVVFTSEWQALPAKPLVTELFAILGVMFLFCGIAGIMARIILFRGKNKK